MSLADGKIACGPKGERTLVGAYKSGFSTFFNRIIIADAGISPQIF